MRLIIIRGHYTIEDFTITSGIDFFMFSAGTCSTFGVDPVSSTKSLSGVEYRYYMTHVYCNKKLQIKFTCTPNVFLKL